MADTLVIDITPSYSFRILTRRRIAYVYSENERGTDIQVTELANNYFTLIAHYWGLAEQEEYRCSIDALYDNIRLFCISREAWGPASAKTLVDLYYQMEDMISEEEQYEEEQYEEDDPFN